MSKFFAKVFQSKKLREKKTEQNKKKNIILLRTSEDFFGSL